MERKQNTQEGVALFPGPMPQEGTHVRLGYGASCPGPSVLHRKPGPFLNRRETLPHTRLGVWLRRAQAAERTCSKPRLSCAESTVPAFRVKPANSSEITQDSTCGTSLSLAQYTGGQHRLRLKKRGRVRSREETPDAICHLPQRGPTLFSASSPWQEEPDLQSHVGWWEWRCLLNTASAS